MKPDLHNLSFQLLRIADCLDAICDIERQLYATGLRALFKRHDYSAYGQTLTKALVELDDIAGSIKLDASNFLILKSTALEYIGALKASTAKLLALSFHLSAKANGEEYSLDEYLSDFREFKQYQDEYVELGRQLNAFYQRCREL
jgi:hypothetical protein